MKGANRLARLALLAAAAMVLSYVESQLPSIGIPGVKLGLANIAVVLALLRFGWRWALPVSLVRVVTVSMLFGSLPALAYSLAGAIVSLSVMALLERGGRFSCAGVSVAGGVCHNLGQLLAAILILGTRQLIWYFPVLLLSGTVTGIFIGLAAAALNARLNKYSR